jgi:hypothetical protein
VTLVFPVDPEADPAVGPPFPVTPELYRGLLLPAGASAIPPLFLQCCPSVSLCHPHTYSHNRNQTSKNTGFECIELRQLPPELSHPARRGREWLGRWRRLEDGGGGGGGSSAAAASKF